MQQNTVNRAKVHKPIVIDVSGEPVGVVVPQEGGYRFLAVKLPAFVVDGQHFGTVEDARSAVTQAVQGQLKA